MRRSSLLILAAATIGLSPCARAADPTPSAPSFQPPPDSTIPTGPFGDVVRQGEQIFRDPATYAPKYVGNQLSCSNCHFDAGRQPWVAPMWAAYVAFPEYRAKNGHVNTFAERLQGCFRFSMNGKAPPLGDQVLVALETYSYFLAKGLPTGENAPGRGYPKLPKPDVPADYARGAQAFARHCAMCHGPQGLGISAGGKVLLPPLWGPHSFNWGAGMAEINTAAAFIRANMPYGAGGTLSVQQAWDVATYVDSQIRPQDPRFIQSVAETRKRFHDTPFSMYGLAVNGTVLGDPATTPPAGTVPGN
ncbi:MAG: c-type cytochrome [Acetobacteraceae bacterium]|nr:c-type cytochrome [Acetobacteraceae bacterium]